MLDKLTFGLCLALCCLFACGGDESVAAASPDESPRAVTDCTELPPGSRLPRFGTGDGRLLLSYVVSDSSGSRLYAREFAGSGWGTEREVAQGDNWFVNWADFPSVKPTGDSLFYHYLAYSGQGTYDYDIRFGTGNTERGTLHTDGVAAEHGFVSSAHLPEGGLQITWLDGRNTKSADGAASTTAHDHHGGGGAMTLRTATLTADGTVTDRTELDDRVCDCCNTATVVTADRTLVVYRDRTEEEIRDIGFVSRQHGGEWSSPGRVHADDWEVTGCPVNGPALAANEAGAIAVAWYTAGDGNPRIQFARYDTTGEAFGEPVVLEDRDPLGRVDIKLGPDGTAYVLGVCTTDDPNRADIRLWTIPQVGEVSSQRIAAMPGTRSSGFPRLSLFAGQLRVAWTDTAGESSVVHVCSVDQG
ncbi:hypothetical protein [Lewinella sp. JB7]|uniref:hypothetical protein n=1 Tax=Lewinella sp. JB7 TaxID=2962887 RepID=UPI0020CA0E15|nr:hypothetical protein [Lewinella sp. JB7]MCP9237194.1 hypothetical protein [Lewinella sp. JB7]